MNSGGGSEINQVMPFPVQGDPEIGRGRTVVKELRKGSVDAVKRVVSSGRLVW